MLELALACFGLDSLSEFSLFLLGRGGPKNKFMNTWKNQVDLSIIKHVPSFRILLNATFLEKMSWLSFQ